MGKKNVSLALLPISLCFSSVPVLAASTAELENRIEQQERQIKRLENRINGTRSVVKENRNRISESEDRLRINGFFSGGFTQMDSDRMLFEADNDITDDVSSDSITRLGIQMTFQVSENISATGQLISRGTDDYNIEAEWAYLAYDVTSDFTLRLGRSRLPYYFLSEYLEVGYAYPWVRPPLEVYSLPISSTDGLSAIWDFSTGPVNFTLQGYYGISNSYNDELNTAFTLRDQMGAALFAEYGDFTFRVSYSQSKTDVDPDTGSVGEILLGLIPGTNSLLEFYGADDFTSPYVPSERGNDSQYASLSGVYDDGKWFVMAELANQKLDDLAADAGDSGLFTVGYRIGKWMPHFTYAKYQTDSYNDDKFHSQIRAVNQSIAIQSIAPIPPGVPGVPATTNESLQGLAGLTTAYSAFIQQQESYTLGVVYDLTTRVKLKAEYAYYENFGEYDTYSIGGIGSPLVTTTSQGYGRFTPTGNGLWTDDSTSIISLSADAVF